MTDPFRLRVLKALTNCLASITPANGYVHDLGPSSRFPNGRVFRGRTMFGEETKVPFVSILEVPLPLDQMPAQEDATVSAGGWDIIIQGFVQDDEENPTDPAHGLLAEVKKALILQKKGKRRGEHIFGMREVYDLTVGPGTVRPPDDVSANAYFWMGLVIHMAEDLEDPYA